MNRFVDRAIREVLVGLLLGASAALAAHVVVGPPAAITVFLKTHIPALLLVVTSDAVHFKILAGVVLISLLLLCSSQIASFLTKLTRSWLAGIIIKPIINRYT
jgi:hypothetical protein